jgi:hypothetical protein
MKTIYKLKLIAISIAIMSSATYAQTHISNLAGLQAITSSNSYVLDNDIDLSGVNGLGLGDLTNVTLDGNFHKIMNLTYDGVERGGLFRNLSHCTIKNLKLTGFTIAGSWAGALAGHADASTISRCSSTNGDVESSGIGGGLIGHMSGTSVSECFSAGTVVGHDHVGGLIGHMDNASSILNCYSNSTVTTDSWQVGGIVGWGENAGNTITNCYAAGTVTAGHGFTGGIVGATSGGNKSYVTITNCMGIETHIAANSDIVKTNRIVGDDGSATYTNNYGLSTMTWTDPKRTDPWTSDAAGKDGEDVTTAQVASSDFYVSKLPTWDFTNVWTLSGAVPTLRMKETLATSTSRVLAAPNAKVYASDGSICVATTENANISIYNLSGVKLIQANSKNSVERFNVKGVAIVKVVTAVGTSIYKVIN